jgi:hypothetical protein
MNRFFNRCVHIWRIYYAGDGYRKKVLVSIYKLLGNSEEVIY